MSDRRASKVGDDSIEQLADQTPRHLGMPERPAFNTVNSSAPLLGDSPLPTPASASDPFQDGSLRGSSPRPSSDDASRSAPRVRVNSEGSVASEDIPSFQPRESLSAPFPATAGLRQRSSISNSPGQGHSAVMGLDSENPSAFSSALAFDDGNQPRSEMTIAQKHASIAARRSMRMKHAKSVQGGRGTKASTPAKTGATGVNLNRKPFESTRLKGEIYKPWLEKKDPAMRWARWITLVSILLGVALAAFLCYNGYSSVPSLGKICPVLEDDFSNGIDSSKWQHEVRLDGYGHGEFEWTTSSTNNSFVKDGILYIVPTLTEDHLGADAITNGFTLNLTADGTCTSSNVSQCVAVSNSSQLQVINPVQSARLITKNTASIKYGKVEVKAKFPTGDWLWPRITMIPVNDTYGPWPRSGEINILEGRGNNVSYPNRGVDFAQSGIHWGPSVDLDRYWMTWGFREQRRTYYNQKWHVYGLEWNEKYMWTYIDTKVSQVISLRFGKQSFWEKGKFPGTITNKTTGDVQRLVNPWINQEENVAPFDQPFYLAIDLAVGATDGWFPDGEGGKPWLDDSITAMTDFYAAKEKWSKNWPSEPTERGFAIDSVKMWKTC